MIDVAAEFDLGEVRRAQVVMRGAMGQISRLDTDRGCFAVKELFAWNPGDRAEQEAALTAHARNWGIAVPREIRTPGGALVAELGGVRWRTYEWFELDHDRPRDPALVGSVVATLHRSVTEDDRPLDPWYEVPPTAGQWDELIRASTSEPWGALLADARPHLLDLGKLRRPLRPRMTCHRDLEPGNVLPLTAGGLAVLDWENAGPLELDQELGCVLLWCPEAIDSYQDSRGGPVPLTAETYATAACVWLNFLAIQARAALDDAAPMEHRDFARAAVTSALGSLLVIPGGGP